MGPFCACSSHRCAWPDPTQHHGQRDPPRLKPGTTDAQCHSPGALALLVWLQGKCFGVCPPPRAAPPQGQAARPRQAGGVGRAGHAGPWLSWHPEAAGAGLCSPLRHAEPGGWVPAPDTSQCVTHVPTALSGIAWGQPNPPCWAHGHILPRCLFIKSSTPLTLMHQGWLHPLAVLFPRGSLLPHGDRPPSPAILSHSRGTCAAHGCCSPTKDPPCLPQSPRRANPNPGSLTRRGRRPPAPIHPSGQQVRGLQNPPGKNHLFFNVHLWPRGATTPVHMK